MPPPPRIQREDTATRVVGAVLTIIEYIPRVVSAFGGGAVWLYETMMSTLFRIARGSAEAIGIAFIAIGATMLFVIYFDPATQIACFMKPQLCAVNQTDIFRL